MPELAKGAGAGTAVSGWQQGDVILADSPYFTHLADLRLPLTAAFWTTRNMALCLALQSVEHAALNRIIESVRQQGSATGVTSVSPAGSLGR